jgi:ribose 1,5-bisphosphokinase
VVGPSGAGKDTLIGRAKTVLDPEFFLFPRRTVTRPSTEAEEHDTLTPDAFADADRHHAFAFHWTAHGLHYAIPAWIDTHLAEGRTVVCNVSRAVVADVRRRYLRVRVIYIDASLPVRMQRIANRPGRRDQPNRAARFQPFGPADADVVVDNGGDLGAAVAAFVAGLEG